MRPLLAVLLAAAPLSANASLPLPAISGVTVDGDLADWAGHGLRLDALASDSATLPDPARSHARARLAWDDLGLLIAVEVKDATPSEAARASGAYLADSIELFLAPDPTLPANLQLLLSPGTTPDQPAPRAFTYDNRPPALQKSLPVSPASLAWAVRPRAGGYTAEARLPWSALDVTPAPGLIIGTRLFVNDHDGASRHRFRWQPDDAPFHSLRLSSADEPLPPVADFAPWLAFDLASATGRLHVLAAPALAGLRAEVRRAGATVGEVTLALPSADSPAATASFVIEPPFARTAGEFSLRLPDGRVLLLPDTLAASADAVLRDAYSPWHDTDAERAPYAFARGDWPSQVFSGDAFPSFTFGDEQKLAALLGDLPRVAITWLDHAGHHVTAPVTPGHYAARAEIFSPNSPAERIAVLERTFFRLPDAAPPPTPFPNVPVSPETTAARLAFSDADATPTHAARLAERWWHPVRRAHGWSVALPYDLHIPPAPAQPAASAASDSDPPPQRALLVYLHGSGQQADGPAFLRDVIAPLGRDDLIVAYPRSPSFFRGPAVGEVIDAIAREHRIDPARVYLMGFSLGGIGTWEVALDQPERFAAAVVIGGRSGSPADAARLRHLPLWVLNGAEDPTTTPEDALRMVEAVRAVGGDIRYTTLPGLGHGDSQAAAARHPGLWDWFLSQRRPLTAP